jgi:predicted tellurium resistance membrane protein TerC
VPISGEFVTRVIQIVLIDLVLSADNAVVIGMAAHPLPPRQRRLAILFGGGVAILLRVFLTGVAAVLLGLPALKAIGGVLLLCEPPPRCARRSPPSWSPMWS